jgi:DNA-binding LytR/AlgR family response regulator
MKVAIIEDEKFSARRLENMVHTYDESIEIVARLESVKDSVEWFKTNPHPDLIFLDIQLEDDLSFTIFDKVEISVPIIFTTAFDEYAIKAFKLKSIDYLLKPIVQSDLNNAIEKYKNWNNDAKQLIDASELFNLIKANKAIYRERYSVYVGQKLKSIDVSDIAYFFSTAGFTFVVMNSKNQYAIDMSLDNLYNELNPKQFFRINRQYLVKLNAISNVHVFPKSRLKLELNPPPTEDIFVSLDKVPDFKRWFDGGE